MSNSDPGQISSERFGEVSQAAAPTTTLPISALPLFSLQNHFFLAWAGIASALGEDRKPGCSE